MISPNLIVFLHIEKTAGSTLASALQAAIPQGLYSWFGYNELIKEYDFTRLRNHALIAGHFPYGIHRIIPRRVEYVTLVRDPIDRIESWYYYQKRAVADPGHKLAHTLDLNSWVEHMIRMNSNLVSNYQSARIAGFGDRYPNSAEAGDMIIAHVREKIAFIDTHDNVDKLAHFIAERTGYPRASGPRKKVGVNKPAISELSKQNRKMLESLNIADYALFHYLKKECRQTQNDPFESKPSEELIDLPR